MRHAVGGFVLAVREEVLEEGFVEEWHSEQLLPVVIWREQVFLHNSTTTTTYIMDTTTEQCCQQQQNNNKSDWLYVAM